MRQGVGNTTRPVRDLGLTHRSKTPALQRALTDFGIEDSFGLASSRFEEHYGWEIHRTPLLRRFGDCIVVLDRPHVSQHLHDVAKHMGDHEPKVAITPSKRG